MTKKPVSKLDKPDKQDTYCDFFENSDLAFQLVDGTGKILHANQAGSDLVGTCIADYIGQKFEHYFADKDDWKNILTELVSGRKIKARPANLIGAGGDHLSVLIDASPFFERDSFKYGRISMLNLRGLVLIDQPTQLLNDVLKILVESSTTREAMVRLVPTMAQALGAAVGLVWHSDEKANRLERLVLWRADPHAEADHFLSRSNNVSLNPASGFPAEFWFSDRAHRIVVDENMQCCGTPMSLCLPDYKQIISVPIAIGRRNWGLFGFFSQLDNQINASYLSMLEGLGRLIGQLIERQEALKNYQKMQESYTLAIAGANEGIWDWDFTTNDVFYSPRWKSLLGFEDHELENHFDTFRTLTHPDDYPRIMDAVQRHMDIREPYEEEFRMRTKGGAYIWICTRGHCTYNALGQPVRMSGSHRDISEIKQAELARLKSEASLHESESKFRQLAENIREVFWIVSADNKEFFYVSPAFEEFWGTSCQSLYQDASIFFDAMIKDDRERISTILDSATIDSQGLELEFRIRRPGKAPDGKAVAAEGDQTLNPRWLWAKIFPVSDEHGSNHRLCGIAHDITNKKEVEKHVNEFYSTISHELRTPLTSIQAALALVQTTLPEAGEAAEYTKIARDNCDRLIRLVNDMLDLRKIEANGLPLRLSRLGAEALIRATVDSLKPYAEQAGVTIEEGEPGTIRECIGDSDRVIQILTNLLSNAIRFTPRGKSVLVSACETKSSCIKFSVKDHGPGIADSDKQELFGPFQQLTCLENETNKGTGLGLAISKALVERLDGKIGINSRLGDGAEFWFELPAYKGSESSKLTEDARRSREALVDGDTSGQGQPLVMILEDSDSIALILKGLLFRKGYAAVRSATIGGAKGLLKNMTPDLIIADVNLPDGNGLSFINWLQAHGAAGKDVPVILLSGVEADLSILSEPGLVDSVRKPFDGDKLLALIKQRLDKTAQAKI